MKTGFSLEAKVGSFVLLGVLTLIYISLRVGGDNILTNRGGYTLKSMVENTMGLVKGAPVRIAGLEVGVLESTQLEGGKAILAMRISPAVKIPRNSLVSIKTQGVMGDKYIEVKVIGDYSDSLGDGDFISHVEQGRDLESIFNSVGAVVDDIGAVTSNLNRVINDVGSAQDIRGIIRDMASLMKRLDAMVARNEGKIDETIAALNEIAVGVQKGNGALGKVIRDPDMAAKLNNTVASLNEVASKLNENKGIIGKLINDEEMGRDLQKTIAGLNRYVERTDRLRTALNYRGEFLTGSSNFKSYLDVKIQPQVDYFYLLGVVVDPKGVSTKKDIYANGTLTRIEEWDKKGLLFNAMIGKRFYDVVLRGGIMESSGGIGVDYLAFNDNLKLSFEAFDFSEDHRAHLKTYAEYRLFKNFYLSAGYDDFINGAERRSFFGGVSLRFDDDDLKTVLGSVPLPR